MNALLPPTLSASADLRHSRREASESYRASAGALVKRILCVVVDDAIRRSSEAVLTRSGYAVATASDGVEALAALHQARYDLLITDNLMPRLSGLELVRQLRMERLLIPIILASGTLDEIAQEGVSALGRGALLAKPFTAEQLLAVVHGLLSPTVSPGFGTGNQASVLALSQAQRQPHPRWGINE